MINHFLRITQPSFESFVKYPLANEHENYMQFGNTVVTGRLQNLVSHPSVRSAMSCLSRSRRRRLKIPQCR